MANIDKTISVAANIIESVTEKNSDLYIFSCSERTIHDYMRILDLDTKQNFRDDKVDELCRLLPSPQTSFEFLLPLEQLRRRQNNYNLCKLYDLLETPPRRPGNNSSNIAAHYVNSAASSIDVILLCY